MQYVFPIICFLDLLVISGGVDISAGLGMNLTSAEIGPSYDIEKSIVNILGPSFYNIREGDELALVCNAEKKAQIQWEKKVKT